MRLRLVSFSVALLLLGSFSLSGCMMRRRPPVKVPTPGRAAETQLSLNEIKARGGRKITGADYWELNGKIYDCTNPASCSEVPPDGVR